MPEIPLSVGSKLEVLLRAFVFAKLPYTSPYTHVFVRICIIPCIYIYVRVYYSSYYMYVHDRGAEGFAL